MPAEPKTPRSRPCAKSYTLPTPTLTTIKHEINPRRLATPSIHSSSEEEISSNHQPRTPNDNDSDYLADVKPKLDDDEDSFSPKGKSQVKGKKGRATGSKPKVSRMSGGGGTGAGGKASAWTAEETWQLFQMVHPKVDKPVWAAIAEIVGRDSKSRQNRYALVSKKWEAAIKSFA